MTDLPAVVPSTSPAGFYEGLGQEYRQKIDKLYDKYLQDVVVTGWLKGVGSVAKGLLGAALLGILGIGAYLTARFALLDSAIDAAANGLTVPVGTVVAWPAAPPERTDQALKVGDWHYHWHVCDGTRFTAGENERISQVLIDTYGATRNGAVMLPNFCGQFLRGKKDNAVLGKGTPWTTGAPRAAFTARWSAPQYRIKDAGNESSSPLRTYNVDNNSDPAWRELMIEGGDSETAPDHYAVYWIIRVR
jgi:hypothetical protein